MTELSPLATQAMQLIHEGKSTDAEDLMVMAVNQALDEFGVKSKEYSIALFEHAVVCMANDNEYECIELLNRAMVAAPADSSGDAFRAKMNSELGRVYLRRDELMNARFSFEACVDLRERCFGAEHPEYASGLLELSELDLRESKAESALALAERAFVIFQPVMHVLTFDAIVLSSLARLSLQYEQLDLTPLAAMLSADDAEIMAERVIDKLATYSHELQYCILHQTLVLINSLPECHPETRLLLMEQLAMHARAMEEYELACQYWEACEALGRELFDVDPLAFLNARFEWAATLLSAGNADHAETILIHTLGEAKAMGRGDMLSDALRQYARFLSRTGRLTDAEHYLKEAITVAESDGGADVQAMSYADLGVFLSHTGRYDESVAVLNQALTYEISSADILQKVPQHLSVKSDADICGCFGDVDVNTVWRRILGEVDPRRTLEKIIASVSLTDAGGLDIELLKKPKRTEEWLIDKFSNRLLESLGEERQKLNRTRLRQAGLR
ncbi:MAG: tetratricopeptide repeat protein [Candidatus Obscuribacterales bacterium]|nr:tetratricopeptide repeat protein [Candidatus Obscuribacterales bacterium]